jgi:hypothetical protein
MSPGRPDEFSEKIAQKFSPTHILSKLKQNFYRGKYVAAQKFGLF